MVTDPILLLRDDRQALRPNLHGVLLAMGSKSHLHGVLRHSVRLLEAGASDQIGRARLGR
jgi:hypothetical protein